jgi:hypothetical protein
VRVQDMLDMNTIVRFEDDACLPTKTTDDECFAKKAPIPTVDDIAEPSRASIYFLHPDLLRLRRPQLTLSVRALKSPETHCSR